MTARHRAGRLLTRIALRDDRRLYLRRPLPTMARTCDNLKTPNHAGASIITCHQHSISILQPDRASENRRHATLPQGERKSGVAGKRVTARVALGGSRNIQRKKVTSALNIISDSITPLYVRP